MKTLGFIYHSSISDIMDRHRGFVKVERIKDEANEAPYIDALEAETGLQIHGDPGESHVQTFRSALFALAPEERDLLDLVPYIKFYDHVPQSAHIRGDEFLR